MPNRLIKESALDSEDLSELSNGAERLFWRLIVVADDFGRFDGAPQVIKARCFPRLVDKLRTSEIETWMKELEPKLVRFYLVNGRPYGYFLNWLKHQQKRANSSKFPDPSEYEQLRDDSNCNHSQSKALGIGIESEIEIGNEIGNDILAPSQKSGSTPTPWPPEDFWLKKLISEQPFFTHALRQLSDFAWWEDVAAAINGIDPQFIQPEFAKMSAWMRENPSRKPTAKGCRRFVRSWLERAREQQRRLYAVKK